MVDEFGAHQVLDIGCGTGSLAVMLAERGCQVVAVDPADASLDVARQKLAGGAGSVVARGRNDVAFARSGSGGDDWERRPGLCQRRSLDIDVGRHTRRCLHEGQHRRAGRVRRRPCRYCGPHPSSSTAIAGSAPMPCAHASPKALRCRLCLGAVQPSSADTRSASSSRRLATPCLR